MEETMAFRLQEEVGDKLLESYKNAQKNYPPVLLISPPQAGKTGAVINGCEKIKLWNDSDESRFIDGKPRETIIFWIGPSDCEIKNQTMIRIVGEPQEYQNIPDYDVGSLILKSGKGSLMGPSNTTGTAWEPKIYHMPDLLEGKTSKAIEELFDHHKKIKSHIIVVMDEAHIGNGISNKKNKKLQVIPDFFVKKLGFFPGFSDSRDNIFTILVSATPGSYVFYGAERNLAGKGDSFRYIHLDTDDNYNSFQKMKSAPCYLGGTRLKSGIIVKNEEDFVRFEDEILSPIMKSDRNGYLTIRVDSLKGVMYEKILEKAPIYGYEVRTYRSDYEKHNCYTINDLDIHFRKKQDRKVVCIIFGSFLQGKTFSTLENVIGWVDRMSAKTNETFIIQSAGRNCGRKGSWRDSNGVKHLEKDFRINYDYPVYIDMDKFNINYVLEQLGVTE
jgi:hypothetical protein